MTLDQRGIDITGTGTRTDSGSSSSSAVTITGMYFQGGASLDFKGSGTEDLHFFGPAVTATKMDGKFGTGVAITFSRP